MGQGKQLTEEERAFIGGMARGGASITKIATETKRPRGTVATILRRFRGRANFQTAKRSGRPSVTTPRDERSLTRMVRENRRASAKDLAKRWGAIIKKTVSERTTRRRLNSLGYNGRAARKKPYISTKNKEKRMKWAREMKNKTMAYWKKVVMMKPKLKSVEVMDEYSYGGSQLNNGYLAVHLGQSKLDRRQ